MTGRSNRFPFHPWMLLTALGVFVISFQNFAPVPFDQLNPSLNLAQAARKRAEHESAQTRTEQDGDSEKARDIREWAPLKPSDGTQTLAMPEASNDLGTIERSWITNQTHLLTGGADQKMLDDLNKRLNRWVKFEPVEGEPWPEPGDDSSDNGPNSGSAPGGSGDDDGTPKPDMSGLQDLFSMAPKSIRFSQVNRFQLDFKNQSRMSCLITGGGVKLDLSRPIGNRVDVGVAHDMAAKSSTVHLQYNW
jgi:hypothetical protein